jgi:hypothetical protein
MSNHQDERNLPQVIDGVAEDRDESQDDSRSSAQSHWASVLQDFQTLGQTIMGAMKETWQDERSREYLDELRYGIQSLANKVSRKVDESLKSDESETSNTKGSEVKREVKRAVDEVKEAGTRIYGDSRPHLVNALKKVNDSIQELIERLETKPSAESKDDVPMDSVRVETPDIDVKASTNDANDSNPT